MHHDQAHRALAVGCALLLALAACAPGAGTPRTPAAPATATTATGTPGPTAEHPGQLLDLTDWKLTLPVDVAGQPAGQPSGRPAEVLQPGLSAYTLAPYFVVRGTGVQFRAPVNGVTTSGSRYPRSELREMTGKGSRLAGWSPDSGTHVMVLEQAITAVPATKKHVVAGQIHDGQDDVITIRLEHPRLFVDHNGTAGATLDSGYRLGTRFGVRIEAGEGQLRVFYNGAAAPADTLPRHGSGYYFKAGAYTQSNCTREAACGADTFGEVVIYRLEVTHR